MKGVLLSRPGGRHPSRIVPVLCIVLISVSGLPSAGTLAEQDFRDRPACVVPLGTPRPETFPDSFLDRNFSNPLEAVLRIGAEDVKEAPMNRGRFRSNSLGPRRSFPVACSQRFSRSRCLEAGSFRGVSLLDCRSRCRAGSRRPRWGQPPPVRP